MTTKILRDALRHVEAWPEAAQVELAEIALEIEAGLATGTYHATPKELEGIDRGLKAAHEGSLLPTIKSNRFFRNSALHESQDSGRASRI